MTNVLHKAAELDNLKRAWHLARVDAGGDFLPDSHRHTDYADQLDANLRMIRQALLSGAYRPSPVISVDVPKNALAVRPGSVLRMDDRIALFAIVLQIAPQLDALLPPNVYSYRLKKKATRESIFQDVDVLRYVFLKNKTVRKRVDITLPWYAQWPKFRRAIYKEAVKRKPKYLLVTDIASYFENIEVQLLHEYLIEKLPHDREAVNIITQCLRYWSWGPRSGSSSARGIPQGNAVSSFLGNIFLHPIDELLTRLESEGKIRYFRYVDDIEILVDTKRDARETLNALYAQLRHLRLTIQGSKTRIIEGPEILAYLHDSRLERANSLIKRLSSRRFMGARLREYYVGRLNLLAAEWQASVAEPLRNAIQKEADDRLFRRLMTAYTVFGEARLVPQALAILREGKDAKYIDSVMGYLTSQERDRVGIPISLLSRLQDPDGLMAYEEAKIFGMLRSAHVLSPKVTLAAWERVLQRPHGGDPHTAQQALAFLTTQTLRFPQLKVLRDLAMVETDTSVRRALALPLSQLPAPDFESYVNELSTTPLAEIQRLGVFLRRLMTSRSLQLDRLKAAFTRGSRFDEGAIIDALFELDIIARHGQAATRKRLIHLAGTYGLAVRRKWLRRRLGHIVTQAASP